MRNRLTIVCIVAAALSAWAAAQAAQTPLKSAVLREDYVRVPMPPGFQVIATDLEGPVFADARGRTLYTWPADSLRNGYAGDPKDKSVCTDKITTKTAGLMSPWPPGMDLPALEARRSCAAEWPPVRAAADAVPIGRWTIIDRDDGTKQWAYNGHALYTSILDLKPGNVLGGTMTRRGGDTPAERYPVGPPPAVPPGFMVLSTVRGRMLVTDRRYSVYASDKDTPHKSNCTGDCAREWTPILAPMTASASGEWSIVQRSAGVRQWAFRGKPVYTYTRDIAPASLTGSDVAGWQNVYTQYTPPLPTQFTIQVSVNGDVLATEKGMSIYYYSCADDSTDQLLCDTMESPQDYRLAICGNGDGARCAKQWPYVVALPNAKSGSSLWTIVDVDPITGRRAQPGQVGALRVWAYRDRPVYTYAGDKAPGDIEGNSRGEWQGRRNGYRAFWIRDEFFGRGG